MIHTVYSNSYEVLRVCLMNNIEALGVSTGGSRRTSAAPLPTATASARASTS